MLVGALAQIAVHPIVEFRDGDRAVGLDAPARVEDEVRCRRDRQPLVGPRVAFERLGGDAHAEVALAVLPAIPGGDDAVAIFDARMGEVLSGRLGIVCHDPERAEQQTRPEQQTLETAHRWLLGIGDWGKRRAAPTRLRLFHDARWAPWMQRPALAVPRREVGGRKSDRLGGRSSPQRTQRSAEKMRGLQHRTARGTLRRRQFRERSAFSLPRSAFPCYAGRMSDAPQPKLRWYQFSLRSLLLLCWPARWCAVGSARKCNGQGSRSRRSRRSRNWVAWCCMTTSMMPRWPDRRCGAARPSLAAKTPWGRLLRQCCLRLPPGHAMSRTPAWSTSKG